MLDNLRSSVNIQYQYCAPILLKSWTTLVLTTKYYKIASCLLHLAKHNLYFCAIHASDIYYANFVLHSIIIKLEAAVLPAVETTA